MLRAAAVLCALLMTAGAVEAQTCTRTAATCLRTATVDLGGIPIEGACREIRLEELCERESPLNECVPFNQARVTHNNPLSDGECRRTSRECTRYRNGECDRWMLNYTCWNGPLEHPPAELVDRVFHNFNERVRNNCGPMRNDPNCQRRDDVITEDYETRTINGMEVTRAWWRRDRFWDCTDPALEETCQPFEGNPVCTQTDHEVCLATAADGTCIQVEYAYDCQVDPTFEANCEAINVCVGDNCAGIDPDPSTDFPKAAAWLNVLDSMADDFGCSKEGDIIDPDTGEVDLAACPTDLAGMLLFYPDIFVGEMEFCTEGLVNCCDNPDNGSCNQSARDLQLARDAGTDHYLETECNQEVFGSCINLSRYYCTYKTKFARVLQEQAHLQTDVQFREWWRGDDACPGITIDQLELLDWEQIDLSEFFGDMLEAIDIPLESEVSDRLTGGVTQFGPQVQDQFGE